MTKKVLLALTCLVLICCMFCTCTVHTNTPEKIVLDQFSAKVKDAKSITADVLVEDANGMNVSYCMVVVDYVSKQRTITINITTQVK